MPPYKLVIPKKFAKPIPKLVGGTAKVSLTPAARTYLGARSGHPGFAGTLTPPALAAAVTRVAPVKKAVAAKAVDPMTRIVNRMIAGMLTPKQQNAQLQTLINSQIAAQKAATNAAYDREARAMAAQAERAKQYALALGSLRDVSGAQTEADYTNAAQRIQGLGTGLTGTIAEAQQAEADQAAQQIAAATQGLGQVKGLDVEGMRNIAQYTGVEMPAKNLYEEAANQAGQARLQQDMRGQQVMNLASNYLTKGGDIEKERTAKLAEIAAARPSLYQQALQNAQSAGNTNVATIISALALQNTAAKTPSEIAANQAGTAATTSKVTGFVYDPKTGKQQFNKDGTPKLASTHWLPPGSTTPQKIPSNQHVSADGTKLVPNKTATSDATIAKNKADRLAKQGFAPNGKTLLNSDWYWGADGKPAKVPQGMMRDPHDPTNHTVVDNPSVGAAGKPPGGETPAAKKRRIQGLVTSWQKTIDESMDADNSPYAEDIQNPILEAKAGYKPIWVPKKGMTYAKAKADIISRLPPELRNNPQMLANIDTSLKRVGFKIPGKGGKPTVTKPAKTTGPARNKGAGRAD